MGRCLYTSDQEESLFIRREARTWLSSGLISAGQLLAIEERTDPRLKTASLFFRLLFAFFTLNCGGAVISLCFWIIGPHDVKTMTLPLLLLSLAAYGLAEYLVRVHRWYRHGVEEALALGAVGLFCAATVLFLGPISRVGESLIIVTICIVCAFLAFWLHLRFGYLYAALIGYLALCFVPFQFHLSTLSERIGLLLILSASLLFCILSTRPDVEAFRKKRAALIQAVLFAGVYCAVNLRLPELGKAFFGPPIPLRPYAGFPPAFYWVSYALTIVLPAAGLLYGIKTRRRAFIIAAALAAVATLSTNKDYLGMKHYAWDPAVMGVVLVLVALAIIRWLSRGEGGSRAGFTAARLLRREDHGIDLEALGAAVVPSLAGSGQPQPQSPSQFQGGESGGGGGQRQY